MSKYQILESLGTDCKQNGTGAESFDISKETGYRLQPCLHQIFEIFLIFPNFLRSYTLTCLATFKVTSSMGSFLYCTSIPFYLRGVKLVLTLGSGPGVSLQCFEQIRVIREQQTRFLTVSYFKNFYRFPEIILWYIVLSLTVGIAAHNTRI